MVAHLQLGLLLQELGAPLNPKSAERAAVYLTNSLTGWEDGPALPALTGAFYPELQAESDAARDVKRQKPILVVIGNPPYNAYAGTSPDEENGLVEPYKEGLIKEWGIKKFNLDELYVRFFRLAERRVAETGRGIVCFITNFSYLRDPSFVVMRRRLLGNFDQLWIDNLNGDSRETGKTTPDGLPDPSVFSTAQNPAGIRKGAAIGLMVRTSRDPEVAFVPATVHYRELWGVNKRGQLLDSLTVPDIEALYETAAPMRHNKFSLKKVDLDALYESWPTIAECAAFLSNGLMEKRGGALFSDEKASLESRVATYLDKTIDWDTYCKNNSFLTEQYARFDPKKTREKLLSQQDDSSSQIIRYEIRPFDTKWAYFTAVRPVWNEPRPLLKEQAFPTNTFLISRPASITSSEGFPFSFTNNLGDNDYSRGHAYYFPILLKNKEKKKNTAQISFLLTETRITANLSPAACAYLTYLGLTELDKLPQAGLVWYHALAIGYSPLYRLRHAAGLQTNWPRLPLPSTATLLQTSANLGQQVAALLSADVPLAGVSTSPAKALQPFGKLDMVAPATEADLSITASWGHGGHGKPVMPGSGRAEARPYSELERQSLEVLFEEYSLTTEQGYSLVGNQALDVYLNDTTRWAGVPTQVWATTIGGYQVLKKWLSYREQPILGRPLSIEEARYVSQVVRRLLRLLIITPALDANYTACASNSYSWPIKVGL